MKLPRRPAAIVFDMDGLLFDTEALCEEAAILAAADGGHDVSSGVFSQTIGLPWPQSRSVLLAHLRAGDGCGRDLSLAAASRLVERCRSDSETKTLGLLLLQPFHPNGDVKGSPRAPPTRHRQFR
jgi:beta-phosphoglucomutase-like phosphatase (HAD superfamily)